MSHLYTCQFCQQISCELSSAQFLTPRNKRMGWDYYKCRKCDKQYIIINDDELNGFPILTTESPQDFYRRAILWAGRQLIQDVTPDE